MIMSAGTSHTHMKVAQAQAGASLAQVLAQGITTRANKTLSGTRFRKSGTRKPQARLLLDHLRLYYLHNTPYNNECPCVWALIPQQNPYSGLRFLIISC